MTQITNAIHTTSFSPQQVQADDVTRVLAKSMHDKASTYVQEDATQATAQLAEAFVTKAQANQALSSITKALQLDDASQTLTVDRLAQIPLMVLAMSITSAACKNVMTHQHLVADGMQLYLDASETLSKQTSHNVCTQTKTVINQHKRNTRISVVSNLIHWGVSIGEIVVGAIKFIAGFCTGAVNESVAGGSEFLAGVDGIIGAAIEMASVIEASQGHNEKAAALRAAAHKVFTVQTSLEMVSMVFDVASVIASIKLTKKTVQSADHFLQKPCGELTQLGSKNKTIKTHLLESISDSAGSDIDAIAHRFALDFLAPAQGRWNKIMLGYISEDTMANILKTSIQSLKEVCGSKIVEKEMLEFEKEVMQFLRKKIYTGIHQACTKYTVHASQMPVVIAKSLSFGAAGARNISDAKADYKINLLKLEQNQLVTLQKTVEEMVQHLQHAFEQDSALLANSVQVGNQTIANIAQSNDSIINALTHNGA